MSGLEIPGFLIGVAGLFSSCVDAFAYFKLAQRAGKEIEVGLLKLDIEKTRLLIWADNVGMFSVNPPNLRLLDEHVAELVERILSQIKSLLTDSEKLRTLYGVRTQDSDNPRTKAVDYVSSKSLAAFRTSASRFWTRNISKVGATTQDSKLSGIRWAIYEREKFQALINDLSQLVDSLYELVHVAREVQDRVIIEDIESILDISQLNIIEEATEGSYRAYSEAAASIKALTEAGTVDRRNLGEYLRDVDAAEESPVHNTQGPGTADLDLLWSEVQKSISCVVLTNECPRSRTDDPCDVRQLEAQTYFASDSSSTDWEAIWNVSSRNRKGGKSLTQLIANLLDVKSEVKKLESGAFVEMLKMEGFLEHRMPLLWVYVYCAPCVCHLHTALVIAEYLYTLQVYAHVRPDDRLVSSCCTTVDRALGLRSLLSGVWEWETTAAREDFNALATFLDTAWMDRRLEHLDYEQPYTHVEDGSDSRVIILGEADRLTHLVQKAPGRIPGATEIWRFDAGSGPDSTPTRSFYGRFVESRLVGQQLVLPVENQAPRLLQQFDVSQSQISLGKRPI